MTRVTAHMAIAANTGDARMMEHNGECIRLCPVEGGSPMADPDRTRDFGRADLLGLAASGVRPAEVGSAGLELRFQGGAVAFISALEIEPGRDPFGHTDTITVVFDEPTARRYGVGPFARTQNTFPGG
jgi:hypothetical protein